MTARHAPNTRQCLTCGNTTCRNYRQRYRKGTLLNTVEDRIALYQTPAAFTAEMGCGSWKGAKA
jgi:hypothetical protein